jgi:cytochrome c oxidase subunit 2
VRMNRSRARVQARWVGLAVALGLLLAGCSQKLPQNALDPQGPIARREDHLWDLTFPIAVLVFVIVEGLIVFAILRFRDRGDGDVDGEPGPKQVHGNPPLEIALTIVPALILLVLAIPTLQAIIDLSHKPKGNPLEVNVSGHQFWWEFDYPSEAVVTATEMHIPTGRPVYLNLEAPDVIHSFWIPKLAGKKDVMPGRTNHMVLQADHPGVYNGQCAEFCGLSHANMRMRVVAQTPADFDTWVASQKAPPAAASEGAAKQGLTIFAAKGCVGCHTVDGVSLGKIGPNLTHLQQRTTFAGGIFDMTSQNLAAWLRNPPGMKPGSRMPNLGLTEDEVGNLVAYLETLK